MKITVTEKRTFELPEDLVEDFRASLAAGSIEDANDMISDVERHYGALSIVTEKVELADGYVWPCERCGGNDCCHCQGD